MLKDVIAAQPLDNHHLHLQFEDGVEGVVDLKELVEFSGVFTLLKDPEYFAQLRVHPELGTVVWDNGADLDPDVLYSIVSGEEIPTYSTYEVREVFGE
ncbi:MAG: DUF2442 domain-containing protein [Timaviella obliquedivisa GSE-PSE-MK23-08B]|jgi:hypothetical protein|nr:DUF2442 domain-containing protein [Timaviella obliquedivisa GSE-PSE-MK23-08B]